MIGKRIILVMSGLAVLIIVSGLLLGSLVAKEELAEYSGSRTSAGL